MDARKIKYPSQKFQNPIVTFAFARMSSSPCISSLGILLKILMQNYYIHSFNLYDFPYMLLRILPYNLP